MLRTVLSRALALTLASSFATAGAFGQGTTPFPLLDTVENFQQTTWAPDANSWTIMETGAAHSGSGVWQVSTSGPQHALTLVAPIDLSQAANPYFAFWARTTASSGRLFVDVSVDGTNWSQILDVQGIDGTWRRHQVSLNAQKAPAVHVRLRAAEWSSSPTIQVDDLFLDNAPSPGLITLHSPGNHKLSMTWTASEAPDFDHYRIVLATSTNDLGFGGGSFVQERDERRVFDFGEQFQTDYTVEDLVFVNKTYYVKIYEVDDQGFVNQGSDRNEAATSFLFDTEAAPFVQNFEPDAQEEFVQWAADLPWSISSSSATEPGHSPFFAFEDSPDGVYAARADRNLYARIDFSAVARPVLRFNHRYSFNGSDYGVLLFSSDLRTFTEVARFYGLQGSWRTDEYDLGAFGAQAETRTGYLLFGIRSDASTQADGWYLDDVEIFNDTRTTAFPFSDPVNVATETAQNWILGQWRFQETGAAQSAPGVLEVSVTNAQAPLTLAGPLNLATVQNPYFAFWARSAATSGRIFVDVSRDGGATWAQLRDFQGIPTTWTRYQLSLENEKQPNVLLRLRAAEWSGSPTIHVDDLVVDSAPTPGTVLLSEATNHGMKVTWSPSSAPDFGSYRIVLATSTDDLGYSGGSFVQDRQERRQIDFTDRNKLDTTLADLVFVNKVYHARVYEVDAQGFVNQGSTVNQASTAFLFDTEQAPFTSDFEQPVNWAADLPWSVAQNAAAEPGHTPVNAFEDSPEGVYAARADRNLYARIDFSAVARPVLRFNHRYSFNGSDYGVLLFSSDLRTFTEVARFYGLQGSWRTDEYDLGAFGAQAETRTGYLLFGIRSDGSTQADGWYLDDVQILDNNRTSPFPLLDAIADSAQSAQNWILGQWQYRADGAAHSAPGVLEVSVTNAQAPLTLAGPLNLATVQNPYFAFWARSAATSGRIFVDVSSDGGATWAQLRDIQAIPSTWTRYEISLDAQKQPNVLLRLRAAEWSGSPRIHVDDFEISGTLPEKALALSSSYLDFGRLQENEQGTRVLNLTNLGSQSVSGTLAVSGAGYTLVSEGGSFSLDPQETYPVTVNFSASAEGSYFGSLSITHDAANFTSPFTVSLTARVGNPNAGLICRDVAVAAGWNLLSVPSVKENMNATSVFPATTDHFSFDGQYQPAETLTPGLGYWMKAPASELVEICGLPAESRSIALREGWNLIGGFEGTTAVSTVLKEPADLALSNFFEFQNGYVPSIVLTPGRGYWVKSSKVGAVTISTAPPGKHAPALHASAEAADGAWTRLTFTDAAGRAGTLYLASGAVDETRAALPPMPPSGAFDVRFATDRMVEQAGAGKTHAVSITGATFPLTVTAADLNGSRLRLAAASGSVAGTIGEGASLDIADALGPLNVSLDTPDDFGLEQSFPNPFRARATIRYQVPEATPVKISVYDLLGKRVAILLDQEMPAGFHEVALDGQALSSGTYFYVMEAGSFRTVRRLTLIK